MNTTCCWTIFEPKLMNISGQKAAEDVELCYVSNQTYLYNGKLWGCSIPGQDNEHVFISYHYFKMNDNQNKSQCTNSSVKLVSGLPFNCLTCPEDGPWIQTLAGKNATRARGCFKGTVSGQLYNKNVIFIV